MGAIADKVATMRGSSLQQIVDTIRQMEDGELFEAPTQSLVDAYTKTFDALWHVWPNKTAKKAAEKAFSAARKRGISFETIERGIVAYIQTKPIDRPWMHLSTFINGERWNDQPASVGPKPSKTSELRNDLRQRISAGQGSEDTRSLRLLPQRQPYG